MRRKTVKQKKKYLIALEETRGLIVFHIIYGIFAAVKILRKRFSRQEIR